MLDAGIPLRFIPAYARATVAVILREVAESIKGVAGAKMVGRDIGE